MQGQRRPSFKSVAAGHGNSFFARTGESVLRGSPNYTSESDSSRAHQDQEELIAEESIAAVENVVQALRKAKRRERRNDRDASSAGTSNDAANMITAPSVPATSRRGSGIARATTQGTEITTKDFDDSGTWSDDFEEEDFGAVLSARAGRRPLRNPYQSGASYATDLDFYPGSTGGPSPRRRTSSNRGFNAQFFASYANAGLSTKWDPAWSTPANSPRVTCQKPTPPTGPRTGFSRRSQNMSAAPTTTSSALPMCPAPSLALVAAPADAQPATTNAPALEKSSEGPAVAGMAALKSLSVFAGALRRHSVNEVPPMAIPSSVSTCSPQPSLSARGRRESVKRELKCMRREEVQRLLQSGQRAKAEECLRQLGEELPRQDNSLLLKATLKAMSAQRRELAEARHTLQEMLIPGGNFGSKAGPAGIMGDRLRVTMCEDKGCSPFFGSGKRITLAFGRQKTGTFGRDAAADARESSKETISPRTTRRSS